MVRVIILLLFFVINSISVQALETVKIEYQVPIEYKYLNESAINSQAEKYFKEYNETKDEKALQNMLSAYCLLTNINKENPLYFVRTGIAYDKLKNDRYAKSYFCQSMCIQYAYPYSYSAFGDYWFERCRYRKALRNYLQANDFGYSTNFDNLTKVAKCYEKLGDYSSAINFYNQALKYKPDSEMIINKIKLLEELLKQNSKYNERERRFQQ